MKTVHFLATRGDGIIDYLLAPVRHNRERLADQGYRIKTFYRPSPRAMACDILCLLSKAVLPMFGDQRDVLETSGPVIMFIQKARQYADKIIWFDTSDSTSVTHFELLPHIDLYLKKQLLKDRSLYQKPFYGGRIFTDFYHQHFGIEDPDPFTQFYPLSDTDAHKVDLSWNIGLGNMHQAGTRQSHYMSYIADYIPPEYHVPFNEISNQSIDVFLRTSANLSRPTVAFHRQELVNRLRELQQKGVFGGAINGPRLPDRAFRQTLAQTKIMPSPFGWGELGLRDYEAFIYGAALLKPDMSHMETWPDIFIPNQTYQPFRWDFSDLETQILHFLQDEERRREIARNGQEAYRASIAPPGQESFCKWFVQQIEK